MLKFMYELEGSAVVVVHAVPKEHLEAILGRLSEEEYKAHVMDRSIPKEALNVREITNEDIPKDRHFRNAWEIQGNKIGHNLPKAKKLHLEHIRRDRNALLEDLDSKWVVASSKKDTKEIAEIEEKKQKLRDVPAVIAPLVEACNNVEDLKNIIPEELK